MITGYNTDLVHNEETYHIQTQERGVNSFVIDTYLYKSGRILESFEVSFEHIKKDDDYEKNVRALMRKQQNKMIKMLKEGRLPYTKKLVQKAQNHIASKDYEEANRYLKEAILLSPDDENIINLKNSVEKHIKPSQAPKYKTTIGSKKQEKKIQELIPEKKPKFEEDADETILIGTGSPSGKEPGSEPLLKKGMKMLDQGKLNEAIGIFQECYDNDPDNYDAFELLQTARYELKKKSQKKDETAYLFEFKGRKIKNIEHAIDEGFFLFGDLKYREARDIWSKALEFDPGNEKLRGFLKEADEAIGKESKEEVKYDFPESRPFSEQDLPDRTRSVKDEPVTGETMIFDKRQVIDEMFIIKKEKDDTAGKFTEPETEEEKENDVDIGEVSDADLETQKLDIMPEEKTDNLDQDAIKTGISLRGDENIESNQRVVHKSEEHEHDMGETVEIDSAGLQMQSQSTLELPLPSVSSGSGAVPAGTEEEKGESTAKIDLSTEHEKEKEPAMHEGSPPPVAKQETEEEAEAELPAEKHEAEPQKAIAFDDTLVDFPQDKPETHEVPNAIKEPLNMEAAVTAQSGASETAGITDLPEFEPETPPNADELGEKDALQIEDQPVPDTLLPPQRPLPPQAIPLEEISLPDTAVNSTKKKEKPQKTEKDKIREKEEVLKKPGKAYKQSKVFIFIILIVIVSFPVLIYFIAQSRRYSSMRMDAQELFASGDYSGAVNILDRLMEKYPNDVELLHLRARSYFNTAEFNKAKKDYYRLSEMTKDKDIEILLAIARLESKTGDTDKLKQIIPKIIAVENTAQNLVALSDLAVQADQIALGIELLEKAINKEPRNWNILIKVSRLYFQTGELSKAKEGFEKLHSIDRVNKEYPFYLARIHYMAGEYDRALLYLNYIVDRELDKQNIDYRVLNLLGDVYKKMELHSRSLQYYNEARLSLESRSRLEDDPKHHLAEIYNKTGLIWLERAVEFNDRAGSTIRNAINDFEKSVEYIKDNPEFYFHLAKAYSFQNDSEKAAEAYMLAISLDRSNPAYYTGLAEIYTELEKKPEMSYDILRKAYIEGVYDCPLLLELIRLAKVTDIDEEIINRYEINLAIEGCIE